VTHRHRQFTDETLIGKVFGKWDRHRGKKIPARSLIQQSESASVDIENSENIPMTSPPVEESASEPLVKTSAPVSDSASAGADHGTQELYLHPGIRGPHPLADVGNWSEDVSRKRTSAIQGWMPTVSAPLPTTPPRHSASSHQNLGVPNDFRNRGRVDGSV
jgi:hypothetical protein